MFQRSTALVGYAISYAPLVLGACTATAPHPTGSNDTGPFVSPVGDAGTLAACAFQNECASGDCQNFDGGGYCTAACTSDADCPAAGICNQGSCAPRCAAHPSCQGECACSSGMVCTIGMGCAPPAEVGMPCSQDSECKSNNCSLRARVCDVAVGSPCTGSNCEVCETWNSGKSYCARSCTANTDCNGYGGVCFGSPGSPGYCYPQCSGEFDPSCGTSRCSAIASGSTTSWYCSCDGNAVSSTCTFAIEKGAFGASCFGGDQCQSGDCVNFGIDVAGVCSQACSSDADCASGAACVACGSDAGCGNQCFPKCDPSTPCAAGTCRSAMGVAGGSVTVCDPHLSIADICSMGTDCASGRCSSGYGANQNPSCIPLAGLPAGTPCTSDQADCASGACCNAKCC